MLFNNLMALYVETRNDSVSNSIIVQNMISKVNLNQKLFITGFAFYRNKDFNSFNSDLADEGKCDLKYVNESSTKSLLNDNYVFFYNPTIYKQKTCTFMFMNKNIQLLALNDIKNSFVDRNVLSFNDLTNYGEPVYDLNCAISSLELEIYRINLGYDLLNRNVFKKTKDISIKGVLNQIDSDFDPFGSFLDLKKITFFISNYHEFFYTNQKWLQLNYIHKSDKFNNFQNLNNFFEIIFIDNIRNDYYLTASNIRFTYFKYENEDFCLFSQYPVNKTIFYHIQSSYEFSKCTCTMAYLLQNYLTNDVTRKYAKNKLAWNSLTLYSVCLSNETTFFTLVKECNFAQRLESCTKSDNTLSPKFYLNLFDIIQDVKLVKYIFDIIGTPAISIIGIILNILIILVLSLNRNKFINLEHQSNQVIQISEIIKFMKMIDFIMIHSIINLLGCLLYSLKLITECIDFGGIYCSKIYFTNVGQKFFIYGIYFIGQSLKTASVLTNLTYCIFGLSTIVKLNYNTSQLLVKVNSIILLFVFILPVSFGLNVIKIYLNDRYYNLDTTSQFEYYFVNDIQQSRSIYSKNYILNAIFYTLNHIVLVILTLYINCKLAFKKKNIFDFISWRYFMLNGIGLLLLRLPEMASQALLTYYHIDKFETKLIRFCYSTSLREDSICLNLVDSANFFSIISLCFNFVLLIVFSCQFRLALVKLFRKILRLD